MQQSAAITRFAREPTREKSLATISDSVPDENFDPEHWQGASVTLSVRNKSIWLVFIYIHMYTIIISHTCTKSGEIQ